MLNRYQRLLDDWVAKMILASGRVRTYNRKVKYYTERVEKLTDKRTASAVRSIDINKL